MRLHHLAAVGFWLASIAGAHAQAVNITDLSATFGTVGTTASLAVPAVGDSRVPPERSTLFLANSAAAGGNAISCGYNAGISLNGVGTFTLPAGGPPAFWPRGTAPRQALYCIAAGGGTPMQIVIGN